MTTFEAAPAIARIRELEREVVKLKQIIVLMNRMLAVMGLARFSINLE